jgi:hypothetical protein
MDGEIDHGKTSIPALILKPKSYFSLPIGVKIPHRAIYNLTERHIILPFKNLTEGRQGKGALITIPGTATVIQSAKKGKIWLLSPE